MYGIFRPSKIRNIDLAKETKHFYFSNISTCITGGTPLELAKALDLTLSLIYITNLNKQE